MTDTLFIRLLQHEDKGAALAERIAALREGRGDGDVYAVNPESFRQVPNTPFCYWVSERIRRLFKELPPFESEGRTVKQGLATADDFRFVRAWWEVPAGKILDGGQWPGNNGLWSVVGGQEKAGGEKWTEERIREFQAWCRKRTCEGNRWVPFAKGGEYSPYYADIHLVVNWENEGMEIRNFVDPKTGKTNSRPQNTDYYFRPGLTFRNRPHKLGSFAVLPVGCLFSHVGQAVFIEREIKHLLSILNTRMTTAFVMLSSGRGQEGSGQTIKFETGLVASLPIPVQIGKHEALAELAIKSYRCLLRNDRYSENSHAFIFPKLVRVEGSTVAERTADYAKQAAEAEDELRKIQSEVDEIAFDLYGFTDEERKVVVSDQWTVDSSEVSGVEPPDTEDAEETDSVTDSELSLTTDHRPLTTDLLSWCVGVAFGRFDIRLALTTDHRPLTIITPDPFDPLPVCPPGMLQGPDGLPAKPEDVPPGYPVRIVWDGILVDDPEHPDDIVRRVREVLEVLWKDRAEAIEKEACEILGVRELRDYFRKPAAGGFWMDHVRRYSKSRRKAPIYWHLRSAKGNYGLWLYYHRLDKDILYKALLNYVEPKIRLEEDRLNTLRARREATGKSGREAKQIEKDIDRQEQFVAELQDFRDKLRRAADLRIAPDLNDGAILNIAPLWELVPWKEPKKYWEALQEGKYDWAHIAYQLWPERVKEKCKRDRSLAIAHDLEDLCEVPPPRPKRSAAADEAPDEDQEEPEEEYADDEAE